jgi:broad specificity phosphatase PhoE
MNIQEPPLNCLLITHNNILQCFIEKQRFILGRQNDQRKIRFKNCAILCLTLNLTSGGFTIELVYNGLLSDEENSKVSPQRPYYVTLKTQIYQGYEGLYVPFDPIEGQISNETRALNLLPIDLDQLKYKFKTDTIKFYIVRHGQAEHNEKKWNMAGLSLELDTTITQEGEMQAIKSAKELKNILRNETIDIVCASDLQRTRQTVLPFIFQFHFLGLSDFSQKIVIVPCANELNKSGKNGNCYEKSSKASVFASKSARENYPACEPKTCPSIRLQDGNIDIDWSLYSLFYDNKMRSYPNLTDKPNCKDTNMVSMTVFYLLNYGIDRVELNPVSEIEGQMVDTSDVVDPDVFHIGGSRKQKKKVKLSRKNKLVKNRVTKRRRKQKYRK